MNTQGILSYINSTYGYEWLLNFYEELTTFCYTYIRNNGTTSPSPLNQDAIKLRREKLATKITQLQTIISASSKFTDFSFECLNDVELLTNVVNYIINVETCNAAATPGRDAKWYASAGMHAALYKVSPDGINKRINNWNKYFSTNHTDEEISTILLKAEEKYNSKVKEWVERSDEDWYKEFELKLLNGNVCYYVFCTIMCVHAKTIESPEWYTNAVKTISESEDFKKCLPIIEKNKELIVYSKYTLPKNENYENLEAFTIGYLKRCIDSLLSNYNLNNEINDMGNISILNAINNV